MVKLEAEENTNKASLDNTLLTFIIMMLIRNYPVLLSGFSNSNRFSPQFNELGSGLKHEDKKNSEQVTTKQQNHADWKKWVTAGHDDEYDKKCAAIEKSASGDEWAKDDNLALAREISKEKFMAYQQGAQDAVKAIESGITDQGVDLSNVDTYKLPYANEEDPSPGQKNVDKHVSNINNSILSGYAEGFKDTIKAYQDNQSKVGQDADTHQDSMGTNNTQPSSSDDSRIDSKKVLTMTSGPDTEKFGQKVEMEAEKILETPDVVTQQLSLNHLETDPSADNNQDNNQGRP